MPSALVDAGIAPAYSWMPDYHHTYGPEVADMCEGYGFTPDPEQRLALDWTFAVDRFGKSTVRDLGICAPRQNLKTGFLKMSALGWLFVSELRLVTWSAHEFSTSQEAFRDMMVLIETNPDLDAEVLRTSRGKTGIMRGNGDESIELRGDRRLKFKARTKSGGRGLTGDRIVLDEAMYLGADMMAALAPTLRAVPDPQLVLAGSAGLLQSEVWRSIRDRGRPGGDRSLGWLEWCDKNPWQCPDPRCTHAMGSDGCALDDESRHATCNTALYRRIVMDSLRADRKLMKALPRKYATETLGWWEDPPPAETPDLFPLWANRSEPTTKPTPGARFALGIDTSWDRSTTHLAAATELPNGRARVEVVASGPGSKWVPGWLKERYRTGAQLVAWQASGAPVSILTDDLAGMPGLDLKPLTAADMARASGLIFDAVADGRLVHPNQGPLNDGVGGAVAKPMSDSWVIDRKKSTSDVSALVAGSAALWALMGPVEDDKPPPNCW